MPALDLKSVRVMLDARWRGWRRWSEDPARRKRNEAGADWDSVLWLVSFTLLLPAILLRIWLHEGLPWLALRCSPHLLLMAAWAALIRWQRHSYVRHRELIVAATLLMCNLMVRSIAANGGANHFQLHGGSPLRLAALMLLCGHALWCCFYALYHRLGRGFTRAMLTAAALLPLCTGESICHRLLAAPGAEQPLGQLNATLSTMHSAMLPPGLLLLSSVDESGSPMQRCFTLDGWLLAFVGVLLPLWLLDRLEQQPAASDGGGGQPGHVQGADPAPRVPWAPMQLYMLSCWAFCGSSTLQMLPALFQKAGADAAQVPLPTQAAASAAIAW